MPGYRQHPQMPSFADCIPAPAHVPVPWPPHGTWPRAGAEVGPWSFLMFQDRDVDHPYRHVLSFHQPVAPFGGRQGDLGYRPILARHIAGHPHSLCFS